MMRGLLSWRRASVAGLLVLVSGTAVAQSQKPPADPLRGPAVRDGSVPGEPRRLTGGGADRRNAGPRELPHPLFMRALDALRGENLAEGVALTEVQDDQVRIIDEEFRDSVENYKAAHAAEIRDLRGKLSPEDRRRLEGLLRGTPNGDRRGKPGEKPMPGDRPPPPREGEEPMMPPPGDPMDAGAPPADAAAARQKVKELLDGAPKPADAHAKVFAILTPVQKAAFEKSLQKARQEFEKQRAGQDKNRSKPGTKPDQPMDAASPMTLDDPRIPERTRERIKRLPADKQHEALRRLQERLDQGQPK